MKQLKTAFIVILIFGIQTLYSQPNYVLIGSKFNIHSYILNENRICLISLQDSYNDSTEIEKKYPIIILLDGLIIEYRQVRFLLGLS